MDEVLLRAGPMIKRPVVTLSGEDVAQVRDVVYDAGSGRLRGFTLAKRGMFGGKIKEPLPWDRVVGLGPDAVMIADQDAMSGGVLDDAVDDRDVIGARVITDEGTNVGVVTDIIMQVGADEADIVGYELEPASGFESSSKHILLPLPDTLSASGDNLVVPDAATEYVRNDMAGFGAAVEDFRSQLGGQQGGR